MLSQAWSNDEDPNRVIDQVRTFGFFQLGQAILSCFQILEAFHHPYYATGNSRIQSEMFETMDKWIGGMGQSEARAIIQQLTKASPINFFLELGVSLSSRKASARAKTNVKDQGTRTAAQAEIVDKV
jgi:hypothetical protein